VPVVIDDKSKKCVFLEVSDESKAYRLYDPHFQKIIISKDVISQEDECWNWDRSEEKCRLDDLKWKNYKSDIEEELEGNDIDSSESGSSSIPNK